MMLFACFPSSEIYLLSFVVCMLSHNKNIFLPLKYIENIKKNIFNNILIAAPASYFFKNCRVSHPHSHPNLEMHPCFIGVETVPKPKAHSQGSQKQDLDLFENSGAGVWQ